MSNEDKDKLNDFIKDNIDVKDIDKDYKTKSLSKEEDLKEKWFKTVEEGKHFTENNSYVVYREYGGDKYTVFGKQNMGWKLNSMVENTSDVSIEDTVDYLFKMGIDKNNLVFINCDSIKDTELNFSSSRDNLPKLSTDIDSSDKEDTQSSNKSVKNKR